jgi:hypothetical protein
VTLSGALSAAAAATLLGIWALAGAHPAVAAGPAALLVTETAFGVRVPLTRRRLGVLVVSVLGAGLVSTAALLAAQIAPPRSALLGLCGALAAGLAVNRLGVYARSPLWRSHSPASRRR